MRNIISRQEKCYITKILEILRKGSGSKWLDFHANGPPIVSQRGVTRTGLKPKLNATQCRNLVELKQQNFGSHDQSDLECEYLSR